MRSMSNIGLATGLTDGMLGHKLCYGPSSRCICAKVQLMREKPEGHCILAKGKRGMREFKHQSH